MVDTMYYVKAGNSERANLLPGLDQPPGPLRICGCRTCDEAIYKHAARPKFEAYGKVNPLLVEGMTDHQYFLCDKVVEAFIFKTRSWRKCNPPAQD